MLRLLPDHVVLLLLDRRDDLSQHRLFIPGKIPREQLIVRHYIRIIEILQPVVLDLIGALPGQMNLITPLPLDRVRHIPQRGSIVDACDRRTPVDHHRLIRILCDDGTPDIVGLLLSALFVGEVDPSKIGLLSRLYRSRQLLAHMPEHIVRVVPQCLHFLVGRIKLFLHGMQLLLQLRYVLPHARHLLLCDFDRLFQILFFLFPCDPRYFLHIPSFLTRCFTLLWLIRDSFYG